LMEELDVHVRLGSLVMGNATALPSLFVHVTSTPTPPMAERERVAKIMDIIRQHYDKRPDAWAGDWNDNAEECADLIIFALPVKGEGEPT